MVPRASKRVRSPVVSCSSPTPKNEQDSGHRQKAGGTERLFGFYFWVASFSSPWSPKLPSYPCLALVLASSSPYMASILEPSGAGSTLVYSKLVKMLWIFLFFRNCLVRPTCDCARSVKTNILRPSPAVCPCCLRLRYDTSFGKTLAQRSKILKMYNWE